MAVCMERKKIIVCEIDWNGDEICLLEELTNSRQMPFCEGNNHQFRHKKVLHSQINNFKIIKKNGEGRSISM